MARALEANGAKVFILDINVAKLQEASNQSVSRLELIKQVQCLILNSITGT